jgi:hypothetical protein
MTFVGGEAEIEQNVVVKKSPLVFLLFLSFSFSL